MYDNNWQLAADAYNKHNAISENTKYVKRFNYHMKLLYGITIAYK